MTLKKKIKIRIKETDLQRSIIEYLTTKRIFWYRNNTGAVRMGEGGSGRFLRFGSIGSPDIVAVHEGLYIGIEVKGSDGKQSYEQKGFQEKLEIAGGIYILAYSMEDVINYFE